MNVHAFRTDRRLFENAIATTGHAVRSASERNDDPGYITRRAVFDLPSADMGRTR